jgi:hypothetical protein
VKDISLECVLNALSALGENSRTTLMITLREQGISFNAGEFQPSKFCTILQELLGRSADFVFVRIIDDICTKFKVSLKDLGIDASDPNCNQSDLLIGLLGKLDALRNE